MEHFLKGNVPWRTAFNEVNDLGPLDWYFQHFFWLNDKLNITILQNNYDTSINSYIYLSKNLSLGENFIEETKTMIIVEELLNPTEGLCYAVIFNHNDGKGMSINDKIFLTLSFPKDVNKIPNVDVSFISSEDRYGYLFPSRGNLNPFTISPEGGIYLRVELEKVIWNHLSSKSDCKDYDYYSDDEKEGSDSSYMKCLLKKQMECYKLNAPSKGCKCVPENTFKNHFEIFPMKSWNMCKTNSGAQSFTSLKTEHHQGINGCFEFI